MKFAVQLYSIRDKIEDDDALLAVLEKVKALGYDGVEFAGYFGVEAEALRAKLDEVGLVAMGTHTNLDALRAENIEATLDFHEVIGCSDVGIGGAACGTPEDTAASCAVLKAANEAAAKRGMRVYYHNHSREFEPFADGSLSIDSFLQACYLEVDTYWSHRAGVDNAPFLLKNQDKIIHLHIKDGVPEGSRVLGQGDCDIPAVVAAAKEMGLEWLCVENEGDPEKADSIDEIGACLAYLKSIV